MFVFYKKDDGLHLPKAKSNDIICPSRGRDKGGDEILENYVKEILFGYPLLKTVGKDYETHVRNKAVLSYHCDAELLAEYLAEEIIQMRKLESLKIEIDEILDKLNAEEQELIAIRYFGKRKGIGNFLKSCQERDGKGWSEAKYFRKQRAVGDKISVLMQHYGLTQERYLQEFADVDIFRKIHSFIVRGKDKNLIQKEKKQWQVDRA